jgi:ABC-type protease/lipase transport system fused ATPase/permease subunit
MAWGAQQADTAAREGETASEAVAAAPVSAIATLQALCAVALSPARALDNIHRFLTGGALAVLPDVLFSVLFIAVTLVYGVPFISLFR